MYIGPKKRNIKDLWVTYSCGCQFHEVSGVTEKSAGSASDESESEESEEVKFAAGPAGPAGPGNVSMGWTWGN